MLDLVLYVLLIVWQWLLIWTIYRQVSLNRISPWAIVASVILSGLITPFLGGAWVLIILPFMLIQTYLHDRFQNFRLIYFYSIYTTFVSLLLTNLIGLAFYLFLPENLYAIKELQVIGIVLLPLLIHWGTLKVMKVNFNILKSDAKYVLNNIVGPANKMLTIEFVIFILVYLVETSKNEMDVVGEYTKYIFFVYIFMFFALLAFLGIQARNYLLQEVQNAKTEQYESSLPYYLEIERLYRELAGFRHDFANILLTLNESIKGGDINVVRVVYKNILVQAQVDVAQTKLDVADLSNVSNPALKSVISAKVLRAQQQNVKVTLEVKEMISDCYMDPLDYVRVVSNLLDNAIEGASDTAAAFLRIAIFYKDDFLFTHIENSANTENITIATMYTNGYSSKGESHGHGLNNVQRILQKYPNTRIETSIKDEKVIQTVIIKRLK